MRATLRGALFALALGSVPLVGACGSGGGAPPAGSGGLLSLTSTAGTLSPAFSPEVTAYTVGPAVLPPTVQLTPTAVSADSSITINGSPVASGTASGPVPLAMGLTAVTVMVATPATQPVEVVTYKLTFDRTSAALSNLTASAGALSPAFDAATQSYGVGTGISIASTTLTPTAADPGATVLINQVPTTSGSASGPVALTPGLTPVIVVVKARDGATESTSTVVFNRSLASQESYIKASNAGGGDEFGYRIAISGDTLVVGARHEASGFSGVNANQADNSYPSSGAAYVFVREGNAWIQQAYLKASNPESLDEFGCSVALAGDTLVVGAHLEASPATGIDGDQLSNGLPGSGAAYVFTRTGSTWSQQAYLKASNTGGNDQFGSSVAISGDTLVVAAPGEDSSATGVDGDQSDNSTNGSGAVYVFTRAGATWSQQAYLKASNTGASDGFGMSVALASDTLAVGAFQERSAATGVNGDQADNSAFNSGAVYVFTRTGTTWSQQAYLKASNTEANDRFGGSVAISGDTLVVGADYEGSAATGVDGNQADNSQPQSGAAYVFTRTGTTWSQQAYLKASNTTTNDHFGFSVAISGDALVVGAPLEDSNATGVNGSQANNSATDSGAAYLFARTGNIWSQQTYIKASNTGGTDWFGFHVALAGDTLAVGANSEDSSATGVNGNQADNVATGSGAVYAFR